MWDKKREGIQQITLKFIHYKQTENIVLCETKEPFQVLYGGRTPVKHTNLFSHATNYEILELANSVLED